MLIERGNRDVMERDLEICGREKGSYMQFLCA